MSHAEKNIIYGINSDRFDGIDFIFEIIPNRLKLLTNPDHFDNRPLCVIIYPEEDYNDGFRWDKDIIHDIILKDYRVLYYESRADMQPKEITNKREQKQAENNFVDSLKEATIAQKASLLIIGGHGSKTSATHGKDNNWFFKENIVYLATNDEKKFKKEKLSECLEPWARVILFSCSAAKGGSEADNYLNMMHRVLKPQEIFGSKKPSNPKKIVWTKNLDSEHPAHLVNDIIYYKDKNGTIGHKRSINRKLEKKSK